MERIYHILFSTKDLSFSTLDFWLFFMVVMIVFSLIHQQRIVRNLFITGVSLFFYFKSAKLFVLLLGFSMLWNFIIGNKIHNSKEEKSSKRFLILGISLNILLLVYFKYGFFFTESYNALFQTDFKIFNQFALWGNGFFGEGTFDTKLFCAGGVSFITFQSISYLVDIYRKELEPAKTLSDYTFFATFFPHVFMGPIARAKHFLPQLYKPFYLDKIDFSSAVFQIVRGLIKKLVLADFLVVNFIDKIMDNFDQYPGFIGVIAMWAYSLYIYGDFSGYTDMATGIARLMGFKLMKNFDSPYKSLNVAEFWRRWHRSLGAFFRDYLYIPLGGNQTGGKGSYILIGFIMVFLIFITRWFELIYTYVIITVLYLLLIKLFPKFKRFVHRDLNLLITMIIGGLWHGPSQNFVIWGAMNGVALVIYKYWKRISPYELSEKWFANAWKIWFTFNFITLTRVWFRLQENDAPMQFLNHIKNNFNLSMAEFSRYMSYFAPEMIVLVLGLTIHWIPSKAKNKLELYFSKQHLAIQTIAVYVIVLLVYQSVTGVTRGYLYGTF